MDVETLIEDAQEVTTTIDMWVGAVSSHHKRQRLERESSNAEEKRETGLGVVWRKFQKKWMESNELFYDHDSNTSSSDSLSGTVFDDETSDDASTSSTQREINTGVTVGLLLGDFT
ncbi:hypothetical protein GOBAR_AA01647 [Gossypium barbadense]|uniref:Uncharacterized protein n=1 Tax=Gossypium barbadense TaxID=3634 RepID=A0A2P5YTM8_GOSBA|nr:hypothetical protein GOBAR_AA01647 [Gossypium barbadense]